MDTCEITATLYNSDGTRAVNRTVHVRKAIKNGSAVMLADKSARSHETTGVVTISVPRASIAYIEGKFICGGTNFDVPNRGIALTIPDAETATLESLSAVASVPTQGLTVKAGGSALANLIGTLDFSSAFTVTESPTGEANVALADNPFPDYLTQVEGDARYLSGSDLADEVATRSAADTALQTSITSEASTRATADTTLQSNITAEASTRAGADTSLQTSITSEASTRAAADSAEATARANADALLVPLSQRNAANGYAGLDGSSLLTESQIPASIARDTEVSSAVAAEASARAGADSTLQANINAEEAARIAADGDLQTAIDNIDLSGYVPITRTVNGHALSSNVSVTASDVGLGNANNTSDANKPVSTAQQAALDLKAPLASPALTGTPTAPTAVNATSSTQLATTAFVHALFTDLIGSAPANLDTLQELAAQLSSDESAVSALTTVVAGKLAKASNLSDLVDVAVARANLGLEIGVNVQAFNANLFDKAVDDSDDITQGATKLFLTSAERTKLSNTSGVNSGDQSTITGNAGTATALQTARTIDGQAFDGTANITVIAPAAHAATGKTTPVDADELPVVDSAASNVLKKVLWSNIKATLKSYFDTIYQAALGYTAENTANKDATGGYAGLTLFKINFKNAANTFTSFFTNSNTAARTYTFQNRDGTIADDTDLGLKADKSGNLSQFAATTSAQLRGVLSDENGSGVALFDGATDAALTTPKINQLKDSAGTVALDLGTAGSSSTLPRVVGVIHAFGSVAGAANSGTAETDLSTYTLPAGALNGNNKVLRITVWGNVSNAAATKQVRLYFGGTVIATIVNTTATGNFWCMADVVRTGAATQTAWARYAWASGGNEQGNPQAQTAPTETLSGAVVLKVTGQSNVGSTETLLRGFIIEILN